MARKQRSTAAPRTRHNEDEVVKLARQRFKMAEEATENQREREKEDLRFYAGDQWPDTIRKSRDAQPARNGLAAVPARPCITVNKTREPVKQVLNLERQSDMGAEIVPADDFGEITDSINEDEIELREGLLRRIQRAPETADAITWGFARAVQAGTGYFGIMTRYLKGKTFDQEPFVQRFFDQNSILLDPSHEQPDGSDADWAFVGTDMTWDRYSAEHPEIPTGKDGQMKRNPVLDYEQEDFRLASEDAPGWFRTEGDVRIVRVVDYYYTERESTKYALMPDGTVIRAADVPDDQTPLDTRYEITKKIKWCKLDGLQKLDMTDWPGPDIPIVKIVGEELQPYDDERRTEGMVRPVIETNRAENYMVSKMVETIGLAPIPPLMMPAGGDEGFEAEYASMNTRTLGVLHFNMKDLENEPIPPPFRNPVDTQIGPIAQAIQFFDEAIKSGTSTPDATLGNVDPSVRSGRAVKLLQQQAQLGTSNYLDNLARSVRRMGVILNGLFYPLYKRPGRLARIVTGSGESKTVTIGAATPSVDGQSAQPPQKNYVLTEDANFNVAIKVTKNSETRNDQVNTMLGELIGANPEFMGWFGDLFLKTTDSPDAKELAERAKVMLAPPIQSMLAGKQEGQQPIPPEVQQKLAKAEEVIQGLTEQVEVMTKEREVEGIKLQAQQELEQIKNEAKITLEKMQLEHEAAKLQMTNSFTMALEEFKAREKLKLQDDQQAHEVSQAAAEADIKAKEAEATREHAAQMGEQSHLQSLEQQANQPKKAGE